MVITETDRGYEITFQFNRAMVDAVKKIEGARFNGTAKAWYVPAYKTREVDELKKRFKVVDQAIMNAPENFDAIPELPYLQVNIPLKEPMFPYQERGVAYNLLHKKVIVGDQPGLGKTVQSIATITAAKAFPCLIVCPSTLKINWQREWAKWTDKRAMVLCDKVKNTWPTYFNVGMVDVFICNYESLSKYFVDKINRKPLVDKNQKPVLDKKGKQQYGPLKLNQIAFKQASSLFKSIIVDESHKCKDGTTQQSKFVMGIAREKEYVLELTGTPVVNKPKDLIPQLHILGKLQEFGGYKYFMDRYCAGGSGASNLKELNYKLNQVCFYRREKTEVLKDLPAKIRQVLLCEISNRKEYQEAEDNFVKYLTEVKGCTDAEVQKKMRGEIMVKMGILKQISARGKMNEVKDFVDEIVEAGEKVVLFCHLKEIALSLKHLYPEAVTIRGDDDMAARQSAVDRFTKDRKTQVIICSIKAAGVGITLTSSSRVGFVEFPWTFADCEQCEDRTHRIGQKDSVTATYFLGENTIDRYCYELIQKKKNIAQTITGATDDVEEDVVDHLLNLFNQK